MIMKRSLSVFLLVTTLSIGGAFSAAPVLAQGVEEPATFAADEMTHDEELGIITAHGNVEINQGERTLLADSINYNQNTDRIQAKGHITLHQPNGDILFADTLEITGDLKNGLIEDLRAVLSDKSRFAASRGQLINDETLTMERTVYSPCQPCQDDPTRPLLWQLKAIKVVHDRVKKTVVFKDAWMEVAGVPVIYTPYLSFPDPTVKRKSGFLPPRFGGASDLGFVVRVPYFYVIDDYSDVTATPIITTNDGGGVAAQYRQNFTKGKIQADGSLSMNNSADVLAHIDGQARFDIDRTWRWGADLQRASNDTYMRRYNFGGQDTLTSKLFLEGFRKNSYTSISTMTFQGLRSDDDHDKTPFVLPSLQFSYEGDPDRYGAYGKLDIDIAMMTRDEATDDTGTSSRRISLRPSWNISHIAPKGDIYKLSATMGLDFFHTHELTATPTKTGVYNGAAMRYYPELAFDWSWPLARRSGTVTEVLEPIAQVVISPNGGNSYKMSNEDSQDFDFNDANLFTTNRFTGYDRVESGPRANYGLKWSLLGDKGGSTRIMVGQSYRLNSDDTFKNGSGLEDNLSDYVGKIQVTPGEHLNLNYRTRVDKDDLTFRRHELGLDGSYSIFTYNTNYVFFDRQEGSEYDGRKELSYSFGSKLTQYWRTNFSGVRDLTENGGQRSTNLSFIYEDECLTFDTALSRTFYQDREIKPSDAIMFRIAFKTLGEFSSSTSLTN